MSTRAEQLRELTQILLEDLWSGGDLALTDLLFGDDLVHHMAPPDLLPGAAGQRQFLTQMRQRLPDMRTTIDDLLIDGDRVAVRWTRTATGPDGTRVRLTGADILRFDGDKIVEIWAFQPQE